MLLFKWLKAAIKTRIGSLQTGRINFTEIIFCALKLKTKKFSNSVQ